MLFGIVLSSSSCTGNGLDVRIYLAPIPTKLGCRRDGTKKKQLWFGCAFFFGWPPFLSMMRPAGALCCLD